MLSRRLRWGIWAIVGVLAVAVFAVLLIASGVVGGSGQLSIWEGTINVGSEMPLDDVPWRGRLLLMALFAPSLTILLAVLRLADRLLQLYEEGQIFSTRNARIIHQGGKLLVALAAINTIAYPVAQAVAMRFGVRHGAVSIEPELGLLFVGVAIIVVGHFMSLGGEMAEDTALTI